MVQRREGLRLHFAPERRRCVRALLCNQLKWFQEPAGRSSRAVQRREGSQGLAGCRRAAALTPGPGSPAESVNIGRAGSNPGLCRRLSNSLPLSYRSSGVAEAEWLSIEKIRLEIRPSAAEPHKS